MKVIDYNPADQVPPIMESDFDSKIIISVTNISENYNHGNYFSYIKRDNSGIFHFYGIIINTGSLVSPHRWSELANNGNTIIELLIKEYNGFPLSWNIKYFIIESKSELVDLLTEYHINESMSNELLTYWKSLQEKSIK